MMYSEDFNIGNIIYMFHTAIKFLWRIKAIFALPVNIFSQILKSY